MSRFSASLQVFMIGLTLLVAPLAARAEVNCGDPNTNASCSECGSGGLRIFCCPLKGPCTVVNKPSTNYDPLLVVGTTLGGSNIHFGRTGSVDDGADVSLNATFLPQVFDTPVRLKAHLTGADAKIAGLLYPVAYLGDGSGALDALHAHGYDVAADVQKSETCQDVYNNQASVCAALAHGLANSIAGELEMAAPSEFDAFQKGVTALGFGSCAAPAPNQTTAP
jgi:hypothetical protein